MKKIWISILALGLTGGAAQAKIKTVQVRDLKLQVPGAWQQEQTRSSMRAAQFKVPAAKGDGENGELVVYYFGPTQGGGVQENINRWIGQFQAEGRKQETGKGDSVNGPYTLLEASGTYNKPIGPPRMRKTEPAPGFRLLAAVIETSNGNYFLKFTGPDKTITAAKKEFLSFFGAED
jgi:gluconolactonase